MSNTQTWTPADRRVRNRIKSRRRPTRIEKVTGFPWRFWAAWCGITEAQFRLAWSGRKISLLRKKHKAQACKTNEPWRIKLAEERGISASSLVQYESRESYLGNRYIMDDYKDARRYWISLESMRGRKEWKKAFTKTDKRKAWEAAWRRKTDPEALARRIIRNLRDRIRKRLRKLILARNHVTPLRAAEAEKIREHIERQFKRGMTWENWAHKDDERGRVWHIDHIVPIAKFDLTNPEEIARANHWTNLRPLWADENQSKGARCDNAQPELLTCIY